MRPSTDGTLGHSASQLYSLPISTPNAESNQPVSDRKASMADSPRHPCPKCGKAYLQTSGLKWHQIHHPHCDVEPKKRDKRTDLSDATMSQNVSIPTSAPTTAPIAQMQPASTAQMQPTPAPARTSDFGISLPANWSEDLFK